MQLNEMMQGRDKRYQSQDKINEMSIYIFSQ